MAPRTSKINNSLKDIERNQNISAQAVLNSNSEVENNSLAGIKNCSIKKAKVNKEKLANLRNFKHESIGSSTEDHERLLMEMEMFYLKKIEIYKADHQREIQRLEDEVEKTTEEHFESLKTIKEMKFKIKELEMKNIYYKTRLELYESKT